MSGLWIIKYMPKKASEIQGQPKVVETVRAFLDGFPKPKKKAMMLYGLPGSGKTSIAAALANERKAELIEINASDYRTPDMIEARLGNAVSQRSLFFETKIVLIDEVDGLSGTKDRGGISAIAKVIDSTNYPIILTANDPFDQKFSDLRKRCELVELNTLSYVSIFKVLERICKAEGLKYDESALKDLSRRAGGDMRAAINDLQMLSSSGEFTRESLEHLAERDLTENITSALMKVFKTTDPAVAIGSFDNVHEDIDKIFLWIDENLPREYLNPGDLARAYDALSRADVFKGRIRRWQYWRFLVYIYNLVSVGIAVAKDEKYKGFTKYGPTTRIFAMWRANMKYNKRKRIAEKIAERTHTSLKRALNDTVPYFREIFRRKAKEADTIAEELDLDKEEVAWLSTSP